MALSPHKQTTLPICYGDLKAHPAHTAAIKAVIITQSLYALLLPQTQMQQSPA